jgi:hypothetical protein
MTRNEKIRALVQKNSLTSISELSLGSVGACLSIKLVLWNNHHCTLAGANIPPVMILAYSINIGRAYDVDSFYMRTL